MLRQSTKFKVLSDVCCEVDIFDKLIHVRHELTGQEGLLLCSHCSDWPKRFIHKADWLAGCFTPDSFKNNPKLVFGYQPTDAISWKVQPEERAIILTAGKNPVSYVVPQSTLEEIPQKWETKVRAILRLHRFPLRDTDHSRFSAFLLVHDYCLEHEGLTYLAPYAFQLIFKPVGNEPINYQGLYQLGYALGYNVRYVVTRTEQVEDSTQQGPLMARVRNYIVTNRAELLDSLKELGAVWGVSLTLLLAGNHVWQNVVTPNQPHSPTIEHVSSNH